MDSAWIEKQPHWVGLALLLLGVNALILNDVNAWLPGAEKDLITLLGGELPSFWVRMPSVLLLFAGLALGFHFGRRFFGRESMWLTILVVAASWLLPNASKWLALDAWLWVSLLLTSLGLVGYMKQPKPFWQWLVWLSWPVALLIHPVGSLLGVGAMILVWRVWHPEGKRLDRLWLFLIGPFFGAMGWQLNIGGYLLLSTDWTSLAAQGLGMLPWLGFLIAGILELIRNFRKKEELAILVAGMALGAVLTNSLWLQWVFAFLIAKQLQRFLAPGYPFGNVIKTIAILQLVAFILLGILGMMYGYQERGGAGFRAGMSLTMSYWIPALFGMFGLFGKNHRMAALGFMFSGLLFSLAFWAQAWPLVKAAMQ